jgi:Zn-dependent protease
VSQLEPYEPEPERKRAGTAGGVGAGAGLIGVLVGLVVKFKALLAVLLNLKFVFLFGKLFAYSWTFILSLWLYVLFFGWPFALVLIFALLFHEMGHYVAFRAYGLPARLPVFVPFIGAYTMGGVAPDLEQDAYIALAGPLTGLAVAAVCFAIGTATHNPFWLAAGYVGAFLNLFNMIPVPPFDGGRIIGALWPPLWIAGTILFVGASIALHIPLIFVLIIGLLGLPAVIAFFRGQVDPRAAAMTLGGRVRVGVWYLATLMGLMLVLSSSHVQVGKTL